MHPTTKIESRDPKPLRRHPLHTAHVPAPDKESPEWGAFVETVRNDGRVRVAITATKDGLVIDGWWRREAAVDLQLDQVPTEVVEQDEAALLIVETLTARKTMTRGAAVYLAIGMLPDYARAHDARRQRNVIAQKTTTEEALSGRVGSTAHPDSSRYLAKRWGCGRKTVDQARLVRDTLHDPKTFAAWLKDTLHHRTADSEKLRLEFVAELEPLLFSGEKSLWTILQSVAGRFSFRKDAIEEQLDLFAGHFAAWPKHWEKLNEDGRDVFAKKLPVQLAGLPDDMFEVFEAAVIKARERREKIS